MTDENILSGKGLTEKTAIIKRFEYSSSPLSSELKNQTNIADKQYQGLDKDHEFDGKIKKYGNKLTSKMYNKSYIIYDASNISKNIVHCSKKKKSDVFYSIPGNWRFDHMNWRNP